MKLGEIVVHMDNYNFTKFHQNQMKNKKDLLIAHFSVQNFKVSVKLWKSYIVSLVTIINTWYGLGKPGTKVANIACKCSPATSPRIWYQSRNNLMASLLINFQEFPGCNSLDISLPIAWYCHFLPKCSGKKSKTFSSKYKTASSSSLCDLCAPIFGKKRRRKKKNSWKNAFQNL